jgi:hypothetical protein
MDDHHFGYITKLKAKKKKKHQLTVHQTHWVFCAILDVFHSKKIFAHVQKHWSGLVLWRPKSCDEHDSVEGLEVVAAATHPLFTTSSRWLHRACHTSLKVCCKVTWHLHGVTHPHPKATRVTSAETRVNFGCHMGIRNGTIPNPSSLFIQAVLWSSQLINCSWPQVSLWSSQSINCSWAQVSLWSSQSINCSWALVSLWSSQLINCSWPQVSLWSSQSINCSWAQVSC